MSAILTKVSSADKRRKAEPFYGWRYVQRIGKNGKKIVEQKLLTLEDVLHPQEGDHIPQNSVHKNDEVYLCDVCRARESRLQNGLVLCDCLIDWGVAGLRNHAADISVFDQLKLRPTEPIRTFRLRPSGGRCRALVEIVSPASPDTRVNDVTHKLREYHEAKVPLYIIIDQKKDGGPRELLAYSYRAAGYVKKSLDGRGRVLIRSLGIRLGLKDNRVVSYDAETDEELGDYKQVQQALSQSKEALQTAERRVQELEAELRRLRGDQEK